MFIRDAARTTVRGLVLILVIGTLGVACGGESDSRDRNVSSETKVMTCSKAGQVKNIAGKKMVCGQSTMTKKAPKQWFPVAAQKKWVCKKVGIPRYQNGTLSICGTVKKRTFWHTIVESRPAPIATAGATTIAPASTPTTASTANTVGSVSGSPIVRESGSAPTSTASSALTASTSTMLASVPAPSTTNATTTTLSTQSAAPSTTSAPNTTVPVPAPTLKVGDIGPGGGIVFLTPDSDGNLTGKYFEAAPVTWYAPYDAGGVTAPTLAASMEYGGLKDWVLPSITELRALYAVRDKASCKSKCATSFGTGAYWSSTVEEGKQPLTVNFSTQGSLAGAVTELDRTSGAFIRAIRSFS